MARIAALILIALGGPLLAGCNQTTGGGTALGGGNISALVGPSSLGLVGVDLDQAGLKAARDAEYRALEFGQTGAPVTWRSGADHGEVVPGSRYQVNASNCRDYTHTVVVGGNVQTTRGTACRQANGAWQVVT